MFDFWIEIATLMVAVGGVVVTLWQFTKQQRLMFFAQYTERYERLMSHLPNEAFGTQPVDATQLREILPYMRAYYDLCSEELFVYHQNYIPRRVWKEWESGMQYLFDKPVFMQSYKIITTTNGDYYKDFGEFRNKLLSQKKR